MSGKNSCCGESEEACFSLGDVKLSTDRIGENSELSRVPPQLTIVKVGIAELVLH